MTKEYSDWEPGDFYKTKPGYQLKPALRSDDSSAEMITRIPAGTYSIEADETAESECLLIKEIVGSTPEHTLISEEAFDLLDIVTRYKLDDKVKNPLIQNQVDTNKWPHICRYCGSPAYHCQVWDKIHCSNSCKKSIKFNKRDFSDV